MSRFPLQAARAGLARGARVSMLFPHSPDPPEPGGRV